MWIDPRDIVNFCIMLSSSDDIVSATETHATLLRSDLSGVVVCIGFFGVARPDKRLRMGEASKNFPRVHRRVIRDNAANSFTFDR